MQKPHEMRYFDYVNAAYERVRDALERDALAICRAATKTSAARAASLAAELRINVGGLEVGTDVAIVVTGMTERPAAPTSPRTAVLGLEWKAAALPRLFPFMRAELAIYPLAPTETQLDFHGWYEPPLGAVGGALDALVGHRIADAAVHRFVSDVAAYLRATLSAGTT